MDAERQEVVIHQSLMRPMLVMGGERNLVLMTGIIAGIFIFSLHQWWAALVGVLLWTVGLWALQALAKLDAQFSSVYLRHLRLRRFYQSHASLWAADSVGRE